MLRDTAVIKGMSKLGEKLTQLPQDIRDRVATRAMREAAATGLAAIQTEVPWRTGNLYRHLRIAKRKPEDMLITFVVFVKTSGSRPSSKKAGGVRAPNGPSEPSAETLPYYWYFVEFGTSKMSANPFMLRGFTKSADNAATRARDMAEKLLRDVV